MRVVQIDGYGPPEALYIAEAPAPSPGPGEVRVRVRAAAVNPADWKWRSGALHAIVPLNFPAVLGYDVAGIVDAVGEGVGNVAPGLRVCGMLSHIEKGAYAEYAILPAGEAVPIPDTLDFATAAALPCAGLTGVQLIERHARVARGERVIVTGALGAVGRFALDAALKAGAHVIASVRAAHVEEAYALGAADAHILGEAWGRPAVDHVIDTVGGDHVAMLCCEARPAGLIVTAATDPIAPQGLPSAPVFIAVQHDAARLAELVRATAAGKISVPVAREVAFEHAAVAHLLVEAGGVAGKVVLVP